MAQFLCDKVHGNVSFLFDRRRIVVFTDIFPDVKDALLCVVQQGVVCLVVGQGFVVRFALCSHAGKILFHQEHACGHTDLADALLCDMILATEVFGADAVLSGLEDRTVPLGGFTFLHEVSFLR